MGSSDFNAFDPFKKHVSGKLFASSADVMQTVTSWLQTLHTNFFQDNPCYHTGTNAYMLTI
jgi:hypothetical protein